jgi:hypothetical protein
MPKYRTSKINQQFQSVVIAGESCSLAQEINSQIQQHSKFRSYNLLNNYEILNAPLNLSGIIYFIGFGKSSLNQTIFSTQTLLYFLNLANSANCKLILVIGPDSVSTTKTSLLLANQFEQVSKINLEVVQYDSGLNLVDQAETVLQKIIYKHKFISKKNSEFTQYSSTVSPVALKRIKKNRNQRLLLPIILGSLSGILVAIAIVSQLQLSCGIDKFRTHELLKSKSCFNVYKKVSKFDFNSYLPFFHQITNKNQSENLGDLLQLMFDDSQRLLTLPFREEIVSNHFFNLKQRTGLILTSLSTNKLSDETQDLREQLRLLKNISEKSLLLIPQIHQIFSSNQTINILFLIQNSKSPTPFGGTIEGIVLATLSQDGISEARYYSDRTIDNLFPGQLAAPDLYASASSRTHLSFSEISYEPDSSKIMAAAANFVEKSLFKKINIVVSVEKNKLWQIFVSEKNNGETTEISDKNLNIIVKNINNLSAQERMDKLYKILQLMETKQLKVQFLDPIIPELDLVEWSGKLLQSDCSSWLPCINQLVYPGFYLLEPDNLDKPLEFSAKVSNKISPFNIVSQLKINLINTSPGKFETIFWFAYSNQLKIDKTVFNGRELAPVVRKNSYSPGISLYGYLLSVNPEDNNSIDVEYSQSLPEQLERFRYQLEYLGNNFEVQSLFTEFKYPPQWQLVSYFTPTVASIGDLRYNVPLSLPKLILEYVKK